MQKARKHFLGVFCRKVSPLNLLQQDGRNGFRSPVIHLQLLLNVMFLATCTVKQIYPTSIKLLCLLKHSIGIPASNKRFHCSFLHSNYLKHGNVVASRNFCQIHKPFQTEHVHSIHIINDFSAHSNVLRLLLFYSNPLTSTDLCIFINETPFHYLFLVQRSGNETANVKKDISVKGH